MAFQSLMNPLGTPLPDFAIADCAGRVYTPADFRDARGLATVAISSNDAGRHPEDGPTSMAALAAARHFGFPYLYDGTPAAAPDLFLYDAARQLCYRGQFDASRPKSARTAGTAVPVTGADLRAAADALLSGSPPPAEQRPSMGCSMKWRPGNQPSWG
jgi:hypothetical protein